MARKKPQEYVTGSYTPIPHAVLDSVAFIGASSRAKAMLFEFIRQHNGKNNGHLHATAPWLRTRGWKSKNAIQQAVEELAQRGLITQTRRGGLNNGPSQFALTWLQVSAFAGLDISPRDYWPGQWTLCNLPQATPSRRVRKRETPPHSRGSAALTAGAVATSTAPIAGAKTALSGEFTAPIAGDNECCQFTPVEILGARATSGRSDEGRVAAGGWIPSYLAQLSARGLGGRQCFQIPAGRVLQ